MIAGAKCRPRSRTAGAGLNESMPVIACKVSICTRTGGVILRPVADAVLGFGPHLAGLANVRARGYSCNQRRFEHERFSPKKTERTFEPASGHTPKAFFFVALPSNPSASRGSSHHGDRSG